MHSQKGIMAEWLGRGLQNLVRRFDSVWYLKQKDVLWRPFLFIYVNDFYEINII